MGKEYFYVALSGILSGLVVFGAQLLLNEGLSLLELSIIPFAVALLPLLPFLFFKKFRFKNELVPLLLLYGIISAILVVFEFAPLFLGLPVSILVLLLYMQPLWTVLYTKFFAKDHVGIYEVVSCILVILGAAILLQPWAEKSAYPVIGVIVAFLGGITLSGWIILGSVLSKRGSHPVSSKIAELLVTVVLLSLVSFVAKYFISSNALEFSFDFSSTLWMIIIGYGIASQLVNHLFYLTGVKLVPATHAGIIVLLEPVSAVILSLIFLNQQLTLNIVLGGFFIIAANVLVMIKPAP